jgi:hypothetical protein
LVFRLEHPLQEHGGSHGREARERRAALHGGLDHDLERGGGLEPSLTVRNANAPRPCSRSTTTQPPTTTRWPTRPPPASRMARMRVREIEARGHPWRARVLSGGGSGGGGGWCSCEPERRLPSLQASMQQCRVTGSLPAGSLVGSANPRCAGRYAGTSA